MKDLRNILTVLAIFVLAATSSFAANSFAVKTGDTVKSTASTLAAALAVAVAGDTVDITSYDTPINGGGGFQLVGVSLVCSAAGPAVINFPGAQNPAIYANLTYILSVGSNKLSNINFVGSGSADGMIAFDGIEIDKCSFSHFTTGVWLLNVDEFDASGKGLKATTLNAKLTNTYITDCVTDMQISSVAVASKPILPGKIKIDHCTLVATWVPFLFDTTYVAGEPSHDLAPLDMTNTLCYSNGASLALIQSNTMSAVNWTENHNAFINLNATNYLSYNDATHTPQVQPTVDSTDIAQLWGTSINPFVNPTAGDYHLRAYARMNGNGTGDTNIGADLTNHGKVTETIVELRQDGKGDFSTLPEACAAAHAGVTVLITQGTHWNLAKMLVPNVGSTVKGGLVNGKPILTCDEDRIASFVAANFDNLIFKSDYSKNQAAIMVNGPFSIRNCDFVDCKACGIDLFVQNAQDNTLTIGGDVTSCTLTNSKIYAHYWSSTAGNHNVQMNPIVIDHCTMVNKGVAVDTAVVTPANVELDASLTSEVDCSKLTIKNSILKLGAPTYRGCILAEGATTLPAVKLSYNDYITTDKSFSWNANNGAEPALGTGELKNIDPPFLSEALNNYQLKKDSPLAAAGEGGSSIGAFTYTGISAAKGWTIYN